MEIGWYAVALVDFSLEAAKRLEETKARLHISKAWAGWYDCTFVPDPSATAIQDTALAPFDGPFVFTTVCEVVQENLCTGSFQNSMVWQISFEAPSEHGSSDDGDAMTD